MAGKMVDYDEITVTGLSALLRKKDSGVWSLVPPLSKGDNFFTAVEEESK
jgi:hypothetical protein